VIVFRLQNLLKLCSFVKIIMTKYASIINHRTYCLQSKRVFVEASRKMLLRCWPIQVDHQCITLFRKKQFSRIKGLVHPKMKIPFLFAQSRVVPNL